MTGKQCPVRITPTRATPHLSAHAMQWSHNNTHINIPMKNMPILHGILHAMKGDETHHALCLESSSTPSCMLMSSVKNHHSG